MFCSAAPPPWKVGSLLCRWCWISAARLPPCSRSAICWNGARSASTCSSRPLARWRYCAMKLGTQPAATTAHSNTIRSSSPRITPTTISSFRLAPRALEPGQQRQLILLDLAFAAPAMMAQSLDLLAEGLHVLEAAIHRCESHVGHLVEVPQFLHDKLTDHARGHLAFAQHPQFVTDAPDGFLDGFRADRPLLQRLGHAAGKLVLIERLAAAIALDDTRHEQLRGLKGREALAAAQALAPTADLAAIGRQPRVGHFGLYVFAEGTMHRLPRALSVAVYGES